MRSELNWIETPFGPMLGGMMEGWEVPATGKIILGDSNAKSIGFVAPFFEGWLWEFDHYVYISFVLSRFEGQGHLSGLFANILATGRGIKVPNPLGHMTEIVKHKGFFENVEMFGPHLVNVWRSPGNFFN